MKALIHNGLIVDVATAAFPVSPEMQWVDCQNDCQAHQWKFENGVCNPPQSPTLAETQASKRKAINQSRDAEEGSTFTYLTKTLDADAQAIKRLYGAALAAQAAIGAGATPTAKFVDWTCSDGSLLPLTYAQAAALPVTMAQVAGTLHAKARTLKAQVDAATTIAEVEAVTW